MSPAAVAGGNVETSQRITDVVLGALAQALPDRIPAASQGTMNNLTIGGLRESGAPFAYYETIGGGMGASQIERRPQRRPGPHDQHAQHAGGSAGNSLSLPPGALCPAQGSGGRGQHRGGDGIVREYEILAPATVTMLSERRAVAPWGLAGGADGLPGRNILYRTDGSVEELPSKFTRRVHPGDRLRIETPGGGGWGAPAA